MCTTCAHTVTLHTFARSTAHAHTVHSNDKYDVSVRLPHNIMRISARTTPAPQAAPHSVARGVNASSRMVAAAHDAENGVKQQPGAAGLPSLLLLSAGCALRRVLLQYVKEEPGALRPLPQRHNHSRETSVGSHAHPEACKQSLLFSARAAGRANGGEASARACLSWPNCPEMSSSWSGMKIDAIVLLLLTHKKWHIRQLAAKQGVRSVDSEGASVPFRVRSLAIDISWCAKHAEGCVLTG